MPAMMRASHHSPLEAVTTVVNSELLASVPQITSREEHHTNHKLLRAELKFCKIFVFKRWLRYDVNVELRH